MKTLTISEATRDLAAVLKQAVAGEEIGICSDNIVVALHPLPRADGKRETGRLLPQEALRRLPQNAHLTQAQADKYLNEVRIERQTLDDKFSKE